MGVEEAVKAELERLEAPAALAEVAVGLARRLDAGPGDDAAVRLARELRLTMVEVRAHAGGVDAVEEFLRGISAPAFRGPGD